MRSPRRLAFFVLVAAASAACTVLNAFDDVKQATLDASTEASDVDVVVDAATDVVTDAGPAKGVIVVGGVLKEDGSQTPVLTALNPENGTELPMARDKRLVASVQYDGLRDLWYVFESNGATHFPLPGDVITLHVRKLDTHTGAWEELQSIQVPTIVASTHVAVLRERLVYVAYQKDLDVRAGKALAVIDTSNPMQPAVLGSLTPLADEPIGLIGTRSSTSAGGSITLFHSSPIADAGGGDAGPCTTTVPDAICLAAESVIVAGSADPSIGPSRDLGPYTGTPAYGSYLGQGSPVDYVGLIAAPPSGVLQGYSPITGFATGDPIPFSINDAFLRPIAFADCLGQALLVGTNTETAVNAIPLGGSKTGDRGVMQHSGQSVKFEPFTNTVLAPFTQGQGYELTAFKLEGTSTAPKLKLRQAPEWTPPADLRPEIVATRTPLPFTCVTGP